MKSGTKKSTRTLSAALLVAAFLPGCDRTATKDDVASRENSQQTDHESRGGEPAKPDSKALANPQVADEISADKPDWSDALKNTEQVSSEKEESQQKLERDLEDLRRLKKLGDEVVSSGDKKLAWLELMSFLSKFPASEQGNSQGSEPGSDSTVKVNGIESEFSDDTSKWFDELPEETRKHLLVGKREKPTGSAFIVRLDFEASEGADAFKIPAGVQEFVSRLQAKIASADLPEKVGTLSHVFAIRGQGTEGKMMPRVTMLWRP